MCKPRSSPSSIRLFVLCFALFAGILALFPAQVALAVDSPSVTVATQTEHIEGSATSFVVPVAFHNGDQGDVSAVSFVLDYDAACVRINDVDSDVTGVEAGFTGGFVNDADDGKLQVAIRHPDAQVALTNGTLLSIQFTLEPGCRPGPANLTDPTTTFAFDAVKTTFGSTLGANIPGTATDGVYTLDLNQAPTDIAFTATEMHENLAAERAIGTLAATDSDTAPADTMTFALVASCTGAFDNQGFTLDTLDSSIVRTDRAFNFEAVSSYDICVQVSDGQGGEYAKTLTLTVVDVNDSPTDITLSANTVAQDAAAGTPVGNLGATDEDAGQAYTYALLTSGAGSADFAKFLIEDNVLQINSPVDYTVQPEYKIRVQVTDNGSLPKTFVKQFTIIVHGISLLALPGEPDLPVVLAGENITIPVSFTPNGNNVLTATFQVTYNESCLDYVELTGLQSGFNNGATDTADDGLVDVSLTTAGQTPLAQGAPLSLVFRGSAGCAPADAWTDLTFSADPTMSGAGNVSFVTSKRNGKLAVFANDALGDCNASGAIEAGDFSATALEIFDIESSDNSGLRPLPTSWLWTPQGSRAFSARGCDSNADRTLAVADLTCTIRLFFGASCNGSLMMAASGEPAVVSAPVSAPVTPGQVTQVPLRLQSNDHNVAAFAATINFDPAQFKLAAADADQDGVLDAVQFHLPNGMYAVADYDAAAGRVDLVATGIVMPLPTLPDGLLATLALTPVENATGASSAVSLSNLSLGDSEGASVPSLAGVTDVLAPMMRLFLPALSH